MMRDKMKRWAAAAAVAGVAQFAQAQDAAPSESAEPWFVTTPNITGDWVGSRTGLEERGISIFGAYTAEVWGNTVGGLKTGTVYTGLLDFGLDLDLEKAVGWQGASVSTTWLWISGRDASEDLVGNFLTISNLAGFNTLRMLELWFQQDLWDGLVSLRAGQLTADSEFLISDYAGLFLNGTFGWPAGAYMNLPEGGPGYPMGTLGARLAVHPLESVSFLAAAFQGDVFAQDVNRHGFRYRLDASTGYTFIGEGQFRWNTEESSHALPGHVKLGGWAQSGRFADALADTTSSGNYGFYGIVDQMLFREPSPELPPPTPGKSSAAGKKSVAVPEEFGVSDEGLGWFGVVTFTKPDRNFISFAFTTGVTYKGLIPGRSADTVGVAFGYAQLSGGAKDAVAEEGLSPADAEMVIECTYQAQVTEWLSIQPDLQYIIQPGGSTSYGNALVLGARASIAF